MTVAQIGWTGICIFSYDHVTWIILGWLSYLLISDRDDLAYWLCKSFQVPYRDGGNCWLLPCWGCIATECPETCMNWQLLYFLNSTGNPWLYTLGTITHGQDCMSCWESTSCFLVLNKCRNECSFKITYLQYEFSGPTVQLQNMHPRGPLGPILRIFRINIWQSKCNFAHLKPFWGMLRSFGLISLLFTGFESFSGGPELDLGTFWGSGAGDLRQIDQMGNHHWHIWLWSNVTNELRPDHLNIFVFVEHVVCVPLDTLQVNNQTTGLVRYWCGWINTLHQTIAYPSCEIPYPYEEIYQIL